MRRIELSGPHAIEGSNNAYMFSRAGVVVDPGPPTEESWDALVSGIRNEGLTVSDIDHVLVTHWHGDHSGLAPRLADCADATVALHENDAPRVQNYPATRKDRSSDLATVLEKWGTPDDVIDMILTRESVGETMDSCEIATLRDGDTIAGVTAVHAPGHTLGHLVFDTHDGLLVGDTILPNYTPNVGGTDIRLENPLSAYFESLSRIVNNHLSAQNNEDSQIVYPGHGPPVDGIERVEAIIEHHEQRCRQICSILEGQGETTPWTVATELFGEMSGIHARMGVGEAASHLEYLRRKGFVEHISDNPFTFVSLDRSARFRIDGPVV